MDEILLYYAEKHFTKHKTLDVLIRDETTLQEFFTTDCFKAFGKAVEDTHIYNLLRVNGPETFNPGITVILEIFSTKDAFHLTYDGFVLNTSGIPYTTIEAEYYDNL